MSIKNQLIVDAIETRLKGIKAAEGYFTDIGNVVIVDRPRVIGPNGEVGASPASPGEMPCLLLCDPTDEITEESLKAHLHRLSVEIEVRTQGVQGVTADRHARFAIADVLKAVGVDVTWSGLADRTMLKTPAVEKASLQGDITFTAAIIRIVVEYATAAWQCE